jgi:hypothetical protein
LIPSPPERGSGTPGDARTVLKSRHETTETMTPSRGFRGDAGSWRRTAAHIVAAALVSTAMFATLWVGQAVAAGDSHAQPRPSASPSPARVKFYVVPRARNGTAESLFTIAARTLGDGNRFMEIFNLNKGRLQPHGGRLENPNKILAGWILELPADASGPRVHFGRLPGVSPSPTSTASHRPSRPVASAAAVHHSPIGWAGAGSAIVMVVAIAGLAVGLRRRRAAAAFRRRPTHARTPGPRVNVRAGAAGTTAPDTRADHPSFPGADHPGWHGADHPSFPGADHPGWHGADHPSFPGADHPGWHGADHPSFPGADHPGWHGADHPSFPGADHPSFPGADRQGWPRAFSRSTPPPRESAPELHQDYRAQATPLSAAPGVRNPVGNWGPPDAPPAGAPDTTQRWPAPVATTAGLSTQTNHDVAFGNSRLQVVLTEAPAISRHGETSFGVRSEHVLQFAGEDAAELADPIRRRAGDFRNADSVWLAGRILSDADDQAAQITQQASDQAATIRAAAEREAAEIRQQAAAIRQDAEREAAELRATVMTMSADLGRVATYVTENLTFPAMPATKPTARPAAKPVALPATGPEIRPATGPEIRPATKPNPRPDTKPAARPTAKPNARPTAKPNGRQVKATRKMVAALVAVFLIGVISGTTEIALHGFKFFVFRANGAGASVTGLKEDQGPGQPDAPGAHHKTNVSKPGSKPSKSN